MLNFILLLLIFLARAQNETFIEPECFWNSSNYLCIPPFKNEPRVTDFNILVKNQPQDYDVKVFRLSKVDLCVNK